MSAISSNLTSDAVADPPRIPKETNLKEQIRIVEQKSEKTPPNPQTGNASDNRNHQRSNLENGSASDDGDTQERKPDRKPNRTSRRNSRSRSSRGLTISNVVIGSTRTNICNETQININKNGISACQKNRERSRESDKASKEMPQHIQNLAECQSTITTQDQMITKQNIDDNWEKVAYNLPNLREIELKQCLLKYSKEEDIGEKMFQILRVWNYSCGNLATIGALIKALGDAEEYICAEQLAINHKSE